MPLTKCTECGKDVSTKAQSCPGCGSPIPVGRFTERIAAHGKGEGFFLRSLNCGCIGPAALMAIIFGLFFVVASSSDKMSDKNNEAGPLSASELKLPNHVVFKRSKVGRNGDLAIYIRLFEDNPKKDDCLALIEHYRVEAQPNGLVSIHVKSDGNSEFWPMAWDNLDGTGVRYSDLTPSEIAPERGVINSPEPQSPRPDGDNPGTVVASGDRYFDIELPLVCYVAEKTMSENGESQMVVVNLQSRYTKMACGLVAEKYKILIGPNGFISIRIKNSAGWEVAAFDGMDGKGMRYLIDPK